ncbi:cupin domain-containing protein [bacterium]|nr:cupin domain-containing protein [bacterium]
MKIAHYSAVPLEEVVSEDTRGVNVRWLISEKDEAPNFAMRRFVVEQGGNTPFHDHPWEHEVYILGGSGSLIFEGKKYKLLPGVFAYIPPNTKHQFINSGEESLEFLCLVPHQKQS